MNHITPQNNQEPKFNYKLNLLIQFWQNTYHKGYQELPTHADFFNMCAFLYRQPHEKHIEIFEQYLLSGIDTGYFPDKHSKACKEFFAPIVSLWHEVSFEPKEKLPQCEEILFLSEAVSRSSLETYRLIFATYGFTGFAPNLNEEEKDLVRHLQAKRRKSEKQQIAVQYAIAKRLWKRIPFWVRMETKNSYPYL